MSKTSTGDETFDDPEEILKEDDETRDLFQRIADSDTGELSERFKRALKKAGCYDDE